MLWVDKYRPKTLAQLTYHKELSEMLSKMIKSGNFPHLLFYGPTGAGKKTRVLALLNEVFGKGVTRIKTEHRVFQVNTKTIEITTLGSNYHIEMNPSDAGIYDRVVVQDIIKEIASAAVLSKSEHSFKVLVLNEVDRLTKDAQNGLRRTMEKYMKTCRIILQCESVSKLIEPLRSRCLAVRVPAPSHDQIVSVLKYVADEERVNLTDAFAKQVALKSERNLRKALLMLQVAAMETNQLTEGTPIKVTPWELFIEDLARAVTEEQSPQRLMLARNKLYELLANCIPPDLIFKKLTAALICNVDDSLRYDIVKWAAFHEHRMLQGAKPIMHLEAFLARFMATYKKWSHDIFTQY